MSHSFLKNLRCCVKTFTQRQRGKTYGEVKKGQKFIELEHVIVENFKQIIN